MNTELFFYGTLLRHSPHHLARAAHRHLGEGRAAICAGALYAIPDPQGWYPALIAGPGIVQGMVYPASAALDLAQLDAYEGADYRRQTMMVRAGAAMIEAQAYVWAAPLPAGAQPIADGDFWGWLARKGFAAYGGV